MDFFGSPGVPDGNVHAAEFLAGVEDHRRGAVARAADAVHGHVRARRLRGNRDLDRFNF